MTKIINILVIKFLDTDTHHFSKYKKNNLTISELNIIINKYDTVKRK